jgi:hypothetical protein
VLTFNAVSVPPLPATLRARLTHRQQIREFQGENLRVGSGKSMQMLNFEENGSIFANGPASKRKLTMTSP